MFYFYARRAQKCKMAMLNWLSFLRIRDLHAKKLYVKCWWNRALSLGWIRYSGTLGRTRTSRGWCYTCFHLCTDLDLVCCSLVSQMANHHDIPKVLFSCKSSFHVKTLFYRLVISLASNITFWSVRNRFLICCVFYSNKILNFCLINNFLLCV